MNQNTLITVYKKNLLLYKKLLILSHKIFEEETFMCVPLYKTNCRKLPVHCFNVLPKVPEVTSKNDRDEGFS